MFNMEDSLKSSKFIDQINSLQSQHYSEIFKFFNFTFGSRNFLRCSGNTTFCSGRKVCLWIRGFGISGVVLLPL
jgi:hypothetical protein